MRFKLDSVDKGWLLVIGVVALNVALGFILADPGPYIALYWGVVLGAALAVIPLRHLEFFRTDETDEMYDRVAHLRRYFKTLDRSPEPYDEERVIARVREYLDD